MSNGDDDAREAAVELFMKANQAEKDKVVITSLIKIETGISNLDGKITSLDDNGCKKAAQCAPPMSTVTTSTVTESSGVASTTAGKAMLILVRHAPWAATICFVTWVVAKIAGVL